MEQKRHIRSLFWLEMTIFMTSEGFTGPKNDYFGQEYAFLGSPRTFFSVDNPLETNKDFP
jgi:hypothetical protein